MFSYFGVEYEKDYIKDFALMPHDYGYLIGLESSANPNQSYKYEVLVLDLSLYVAGSPDCWVYNIKDCVSDGNAFWSYWEPQYGYYILLFRLYDEDDNLLDEEIYGFANT